MTDLYPWQQKQCSDLLKRAEANNLHHALLLQGKNGAGRDNFALQLGRTLLCEQLNNCGQCQSCLLHKTDAHPDLRQINSDKQIGVDLIREAIQQLQAKSHISRNKVLIIHAADSMTEAAANALLKTLEEPPHNTYLLLTLETLQGVLPTVISRCEKVRLSVPDETACQNWLQQQGIDHVPPDLFQQYRTEPLTLQAQLSADLAVSQPKVIQGLQAFLQQQTNADELASQWQQHAESVAQWLVFWLAQQSRRQLTDQRWHLYQRCLKKQQQLAQTGTNKSLILIQMLADIRQHQS